MKKIGKTPRSLRHDLNQIPYDYTMEVTNRFKGLDLIDRVLEELRMEVCDIVQEAGIKTIPKKKKCKKTKWLSEEVLQILMKRREVKGKGENESYTNLNVEFQRISRRDKKAFISDQYKEIEENNRMGKTRDLFKKVRDTKGTFHATAAASAKLLLCKDGLNKGRKWYGPREQKILRSGGKNTQKNCTKKNLYDQDNHNGLSTHLEPDILVCGHVS